MLSVEESDRHDLLVKVAWLYYEESLTQQEIAKLLQISRAKVQRYLSQSRESGIVKIEINDRLVSCLRIEQKLKERFGLSNCLVVPSPVRTDEIKETLGRALASHLAEVVRDNQVLGLGWGTTISAVGSYLQKKPMINFTVVSLLGGFAQRIDANAPDIARKFASAFGAQCYYLAAPAIANSEKDKEVILSQDTVSEVLRLAQRCDIALIGIGNIAPDCSFAQAGFLTQVQIQELKNQGIVGDILGRFFNIRGEFVESEIHNRTIGLPSERLKDIPLVIGVAGGPNKTEAILGALRSGYLDCMVLDEDTAGNVLMLDNALS